MKPTIFTKRIAWLTAGLTAGAVAVLLCGTALAGPDKKPTKESAEKPAAWTAPRANEVKSQVFEWLKNTKVHAAAQTKAMALWGKLPASPSGGELLDCLTASLALADDNVAALVTLCGTRLSRGSFPS